MRPRRNRPLFIIDIAMPRDVEPAAGEIEQVFLYNIDDLQATVRENLARRASEVARAEAIVDEEVEKFGGWFRSRGAIPTVVALRQRFEAIRRAELERLDFKLSALPPEARARVDEITRLIVEKLLLTPTEQLKSLGDAETVGAYSEALTRLFGAATEHADDSRARTRAARARTRRAVQASDRPGSADRQRSHRMHDHVRSFGSARAAASSRCGRPTPSPRASPQPAGRRAAIVVIKTSGDRLQERAAVGSRRQAAVREGNRGRAARAARSTSPCTAARTCRRVLPDGLTIAGVLPREDPLDAVVLAGQARGPLQRASQTLERARRARSASRRRSARAACGASRS